MDKTLRDLRKSKPRPQRRGTSGWWWTNVCRNRETATKVRSDLPDDVYLQFVRGDLLPRYPDDGSLHGGSCHFDRWRRAAGFKSRRDAMRALTLAINAASKIESTGL